MSDARLRELERRYFAGEPVGAELRDYLLRVDPDRLTISGEVGLVLFAGPRQAEQALPWPDATGLDPEAIVRAAEEVSMEVRRRREECMLDVLSMEVRRRREECMLDVPMGRTSSSSDRELAGELTRRAVRRARAAQPAPERTRRARARRAR